MDYVKSFTSNDKIERLVSESFISIVQDEAEIVFHPYVQDIGIKNYYIGEPVDGIDPYLQITYKGLKFIFYLSDSGDVNKAEKTISDLDVMVRAFCDLSSDYRVYVSEIKSAAQIAVVEKNTGKIYSSSLSQGASVKARVDLMFRKLKQIDA